MILNWEEILTNTLSGIIINLPWFILVWLGFKLIAREIHIGVKQIPKWIEQYFKMQREQLVIQRAITHRSN